MRWIQAGLRTAAMLFCLLSMPVVAAVAEEPYLVLQPGESVRIASWNLKWFFDADTSDNTSRIAQDESAPDDAEFRWRVEQFAAAVAAIRPAILAVQEIENEKVVEDLARALRSAHGLRYKVGFVQGNDTALEQDVAFLYEDRPGTVRTHRIPDPDRRYRDGVERYTMPSKHCCLRFAAKIGATARTVEIVNVHLKAGSGEANESQRVRQSRVVNHYARGLAADGTWVIVLGDMNARGRFEQTDRNDGMGVLTGRETDDASDDLRDLHGLLPAERRATHVAGRALDRIVVGPGLLDGKGLTCSSLETRRDLAVRGAVDPEGSMYRVPRDRRDLADHFPLIAVFAFRP